MQEQTGIARICVGKSAAIEEEEFVVVPPFAWDITNGFLPGCLYNASCSEKLVRTTYFELLKVGQNHKFLNFSTISSEHNIGENPVSSV